MDDREHASVPILKATPHPEKTIKAENVAHRELNALNLPRVCDMFLGSSAESITTAEAR